MSILWGIFDSLDFIMNFCHQHVLAMAISAKHFSFRRLRYAPHPSSIPQSIKDLQMLKEFFDQIFWHNDIVATEKQPFSRVEVHRRALDKAFDCRHFI